MPSPLGVRAAQLAPPLLLLLLLLPLASAQSVVPWITTFLVGGGGGSGTNFPASGAAAGIGTNALFSKPSSGSYYTSLGNNYFVIADTQNNVVVQVTLPPSGPATTFVLAGSVSACARNDDVLCRLWTP